MSSFVRGVAVTQTNATKRFLLQRSGAADVVGADARARGGQYELRRRRRRRVNNTRIIIFTVIGQYTNGYYRIHQARNATRL